MVGCLITSYNEKKKSVLLIISQMSQTSNDLVCHDEVKSWDKN
jgi:hypothetical protein